jgi:hypothetical protein
VDRLKCFLGHRGFNYPGSEPATHHGMEGFFATTERQEAVQDIGYVLSTTIELMSLRDHVRKDDSSIFWSWLTIRVAGQGKGDLITGSAGWSHPCRS